MKICLVTAFPPSRHALNEYGFHIARELRETPGLSLTVLGDDITADETELPDYEVIRCWSFNALSNPWRLLRAIRSVQPDVVWFNFAFASFGGKPLPAFLGAATPAIVRLSGHYTHATIHQLMETVDLKDAGVRYPFLYNAAGFIATQLLLFSNSVSVLLPAYRSILRHKYRRGAVYVRNHGVLSGRPEYPDFAQRGNPDHRILAFGKWGTYKRLEPMIEAFEMVSRQDARAKLVVGGMDHPKTPGYLESIARQYWRHPRMEFIGYIAEARIPSLFQSTSVAVMPYTSSAGSSGVAHLACAYGVPIIASDIADFRQLAEEEGLAINFFEPGNVQSLAERLLELLNNSERQMEMGIQNFSTALRMSMPEIIRQYLRTFELQRQLSALTSVSRLRRLPRWMRPHLTRAVSRRLSVSNSAQFAAARLGNGQHNGNGGVSAVRHAVNVYGESSVWRVEAGNGVGTTDSSAGAKHQSAKQEQAEQEPRANSLSLQPAPLNGNGQGGYSEGRKQ
jgi:glycosyltransferase involved in cell wall biosynthesis